jgi:hypothetical protein
MFREIAILLPCFCGLTARAAIIDVPADYPTIQAAINASVDGDVVVVAPGSYVGASNRDLDFGGRAITVRSIDPGDPQVVAATVINCQQAGRGFILHSGETTASVIDGLTIINGFSTDGPGVYLLDGSGATIRRCVFTAHTLPAASAVIQNDNLPPDELADLSVTDCTIQGNTGGGIATQFVEDIVVAGCTVSGNFGTGVSTGYFGPLTATALVEDCLVECNGGNGIELAGDQVEVSRCTVFGNGGTGVIVEESFNGNGVVVSNCSITANTSELPAGGLNLSASTLGVLRNCLLANNTGASAGGAVLSGFGAFEITTSTFTSNVATEFGGGAFRAFGTDPVSILNCIFWDNTAPEGPEIVLDSGFNAPAVVSMDYCDLEGGAAAVAVDRGLDASELIFGLHNIDADPLFADSGSAGFQLSADSPAVDAGDPAFIPQPGETDLDGGPRVVGGRVDMGADEFRQPADLDGDGSVGILDLLMLLAAWGPCDPPCPPSCPGDIDGDCTVGIVDLLQLLANWS